MSRQVIPLRPVLLAATAVCFCATLAAAPEAARRGFSGPGRYASACPATRQALELAADGTTIAQQVRSALREQQWEFEKAQGDFYLIRRAAYRRAIEHIGEQKGARQQAN